MLTDRTSIYRGLGGFFFGLGTLGIGVPLLPTVPFWILAAFCYARSSPDLRDRIYAHPTFGPPVRDFLEQGALSRRAKFGAIGGMSGGVLLSVLAFGLPWPVAGLIALALAPVAWWLARRPERAASAN